MNSSILIPLSRELEGQAKLILKGAGLAALKPKFFNIDYVKAAREEGTYELSPRYGYDKKGGMFGLPIWDTVTLVSPAYTDDNGSPIPSQRMTLDLALIEVSNDRNIVKTQVAGRNGTVKEYMSDGDNGVTIRGSLVSDTANLPPIELLEAFQFITSVPVTLTVESNFLEYMRVFDLVIDKPILRQRLGARNIIDYELHCSSDLPFEIDA